MTAGRWGQRMLLLLAVAALVSACAVREQRPAGTWMEERAAWFDEHPVWSVSGRAAIRDGQRGGQISFEWQAEGERHRVHLRTVTGGRQWLLQFEPGHAELEGTDVRYLVGPDPNALVESAVGWRIPVVELSDWIRGLVSEELGEVRFAHDGTLERVRFEPWDLSYQHFVEIEGRLMPARLEAESPPYRVRLVLRDWKLKSREDIEPGFSASVWH
ncbi:outer membrane lipoprotein LolB [Wenzhouxiangella sp. AB-CW3]|uniref:lipoprotein insertase outer membrane protein LolB n=1 Tax=Wenzhouxiangella sp. AB-CW3 TaxID=2771012 RepID=UPI00168B03D2|nr:lipoprotein insertase outer membrane protein LolB [Wenzhouxiangella sp. AB-CW3]QOC23886.1 outer membrane lipoprotein LolB [Wenzhouxiangella sp. AB-CW3]